MTVLFTRTATPVPGKQAEGLEFMKKRAEALKAYGVSADVYVRTGGTFAQMVTVSRHGSLQELENLERKLIQDSLSGKLPVSSDHRIWERVEDAYWLVKSE